jgi:hypothetical protein
MVVNRSFCSIIISNPNAMQCNAMQCSLMAIASLEAGVQLQLQLQLQLNPGQSRTKSEKWSSRHGKTINRTGLRPRFRFSLIRDRNRLASSCASLIATGLRSLTQCIKSPNRFHSHDKVSQLRRYESSIQSAQDKIRTSAIEQQPRLMKSAKGIWDHEMKWHYIAAVYISCVFYHRNVQYQPMVLCPLVQLHFLLRRARDATTRGSSNYAECKTVPDFHKLPLARARRTKACVECMLRTLAEINITRDLAPGRTAFSLIGSAEVRIHNGQRGQGNSEKERELHHCFKLAHHCFKLAFECCELCQKFVPQLEFIKLRSTSI